MSIIDYNLNALRQGPRVPSRTTLSTRLKYVRGPRRCRRHHLAALGATELADSIQEHASTPAPRASRSPALPSEVELV